MTAFKHLLNKCSFLWRYLHPAQGITALKTINLPQNSNARKNDTEAKIKCIF